MPLIRTAAGVQVLHDWQPGRIGLAYMRLQPAQGESALAIQVVLLRKPPRPLAEPVPVPVSDEVEKLVKFLNG